MSIPTDAWPILTFPNPQQLTPIIVQLHHAAQLIAMVGDSLLPKAEDDSQSNLGWRIGGAAFPGQPLPGGHRFELYSENLDIGLVNGDDQLLDRFHLVGLNREQAVNRIREIATAHGLHGEAIHPIRHFTLPDHPILHGAPFQMEDEILLKEAAHYRSVADIALRYFAEAFPGTGPVRIWPHHFDSGTVITAPASREGYADCTIGIGLAIADADVAEPYFYINHTSPNEAPAYDDLPALDAGYWHTRNWTGAILPISELPKRPTARGQADLVEAFFRQGIEHSRQLLGAAPKP